MDLKHVFDVPEGSADVSLWLCSLKERYYSDDITSRPSLPAPDFKSGKLPLPHPIINPYYYRSYPTLAAALGVDEGCFADLARCKACIYTQDELDTDALIAENERFKNENPAYAIKEYKLPNKLDGDLVFRYNAQSGADTDRYADKGVKKLLSLRDPYAAIPLLYRMIDTGLYPNARERLCAINALKADGFVADDLFLTQIPLPEKAVKTLAGSVEEFTRYPLGELYIKLYARAARFAKISKMNPPKLIVHNEMRMLTEAVEKIYLMLADEVLSKDATATDTLAGSCVEPLSPERIRELCPKRYEGELPFIYICFPEDNSKEAAELIESMTDSGYRVFFHTESESSDEAIEHIAERISTAEEFILLLSEASVRSFSCRSEINFAIAAKKTPFIISLDEAMLPVGMKMQLGVGEQAMLSDHGSIKKLCDALISENVWQSAREKR